ncbi:MAG: LysR family transcriptional regulator [Selenomonadaceae bacterium]
MEIRVLRYFLAVAREENISRAAEKLHVTQPTLSRQLADLEDEIGMMLFRRGRRITLTEAGMILRRRAEEVVALMDKIETDFAEADDVSGTISIGSGIYDAFAPLSALMDEFVEQYPKVQYDVFTGTADILKERLDHGLLDFAVLQEPIDVSHYDYFRLREKEFWCLAMNAQNPLASKKTIKREDIVGHRLFLPARLAVRHEVENWLGNLDDFSVVVYQNLAGNGLSSVERGFAEMITLKGSVKYVDPARFAVRPLAPALTSSVVLAWKKMSPIFGAASKFLDFVQERKTSE